MKKAKEGVHLLLRPKLERTRLLDNHWWAYDSKHDGYLYYYEILFSLPVPT